MDRVLKRDIISVLTKALSLIKKQDFLALKGLSNHVIHDASILQNKDSIQIAVVVYALAKILEREKEHGHSVSSHINILIEKALNHLVDNDEEDYRNEIKNLLKKISDTDQQLFMYIQRVIEKANVVKGSNLYKHGISLGRASEILGISQWELMSFVGKTRIADEEKITDVTKRLSFAKKLFGIP